MNRLLYTFILILFYTSVQAQQEVQNTFFMYNQQLYNPSFVGSHDSPSFTALYRNQWAGFEGAPVSQMLSFQSPFLNEKVGIGANISHFKMGITNSWFASLAYSYKLQLTEDLNLRLGLQASMKYMGIDFSDDQVVLSVLNDPSVSTGAMNQQYSANVGMGMYLTYKDIFHFGVAVPQVYPNNISLNREAPNPASNRPHLYINFGAKARVSDDVVLSPNVLVKYVENAPLDMDWNINFIFNEKLLAGMSYRVGGNDTGESIDFLVMYQVHPQFKVGMAYDFTLSDIRDFSSGSYELLLRYELKREREDLENPRYF